MIRSVVIRNVFEPQRREADGVAWHEGMTTGDVARERGLDPERSTYWINGKAKGVGEFELQEGDWVHLVVAPQGAFIALAIEMIKIAFILYVARMVIDLLFGVDEPSDPPPNEPFFGFQNTYRPEGDAIPVVYGRIRVAPPCINQSVLGNVPGMQQTLGASRHETLNSLFAVSHGPIAGFFEESTREINNSGDFAGIYVPGYMAQKLALQINGVDARHYEGAYEWRTGGPNQTAIIGSNGFVNYSNPGTSFEIGLELETVEGTESIPESGTGQRPFGARITEDDAHMYVHQFCVDPADRASVSIHFKKGLYHLEADSGNYRDNFRSFQIQYWQTDASGLALPALVTILPFETIVGRDPNPFTCEYAWSFNNPSTVTGASESKGCARLVSGQVDGRLMMDGSATALANLALVCPGVPCTLQTYTGGYRYASFDQALKFSWAGWVGVPGWVTGFGPGVEPQAFLWSWGREQNITDRWEFDGVGSPCSAQNMWSPPYLVDGSITSGDSFGCSAILFLDVENVLGGTGDSSDPAVYLKVYTWESNNGWNNAGNPTKGSNPLGASETAGYLSCFVSEQLGVASGFGDSSGTTKHIGFTWDQTTYRANGGTSPSSATGGLAIVKCYVNGIERSMSLSEMGSTLGGGLPGGFGGYNEYLYGLNPLAGPHAGQRHVPLRFFTDDKTTLRLGGFGNVSTTSSTAPEANSEFYLSETVFYEGILDRAWFIAQYSTADSFGNWPVASVASMVGTGQYSAGCRIVMPLDDGEVVATDFYKNLKLPDATTQATGALEIASVASTVRATGSSVVTAQSGQTLKGHYVVEIFVKKENDHGEASTRWENDVTIRRLTTWASEVYSYPGIAVVSTAIQGNAQIANSRPTITMGVLGRKVDVWDGQNAEFPSFISMWSNNPAWVALDMLTNHEYGVGDIFSPDGTYDMLELPSFLEWGAFCDAGVPDAYGNIEFYGIATGFRPGVGGIGYPNRVTLMFGIMDSAGVLQQTIPLGWAIGKFLSITIIDQGVGMDPEWVTANDLESGYNNCSALCEITNFTYEADTNAPNGWMSWCSVEVAFNRDYWPNTNGGLVQDGSQDPFPWGGGENFAGVHGKLRLGTASGFEARCRFNHAFTSKGKDAWDGILTIFQAGRAMPFKMGRRIMPVWDRPRDPVGLVGQGNIIEGSFEISYTDPKSVPNSIEIEILDADRNYMGQTVAVDHPSTQGTTEFQEVRKERISYTGCTSRSQATREGIYRLNKYNGTTRQAKFKVGPDCIHLMPGDRILVSHDVPKYGVGGRLPVAMVLHNLHPGSESLFSSWTAQEGSCTISSRSLLEDTPHATMNPPLLQYNGGVTLAYGVPVVESSGIETLAGQNGGDGWEQHTEWATQHVCYGDGLYATPDNLSGVTSPLDVIGTVEKRVSFSAYVKQPNGNGASSSSFALIIYRLCGDGGYVKKSHGVRFDWNGSGAPVLGAYIGDGTGLSSPYGVSYHVTSVIYGDWYRVTVSYDNDSATGAGAAALNDYLQARLFYSYVADTFANQPTLFSVSGNVGRGNQFIYYGDPTDIDGRKANGNHAWTGIYCRSTVVTTRIVTDLTIAPPFYADETLAGAGDAGEHGFVMKFIKQASTAASANRMMATQTFNLPYTTDASSPVQASAAGGPSYTGCPLCFTCFVRRSHDGSGYVDAEVVINVRVGTTISSAGTGELLTDDGIEVNLAYTAATDTWVVSSTLEHETGPHTITGHNSSVTRARNTSLAGSCSGAVGASRAACVLAGGTWVSGEDDDWWQVDISFTATSAPVSAAGVQIGSRSTGSADKSFYVWGLRLHGAAGTSGTTYVNPYPHRGTLVWGSMWEPNFIDPLGTGEAGTFSIGADIQLDRDVEVTAGNTYELALRSSFVRDEPRRTDAQEVVKVSYSEVPDTGTITKYARNWISIKAPNTFFPRTGDLYSFGETGEATEDFIIQGIDTEPQTLERTITCVSYNAAMYNDTSFEFTEGGNDDGSGGVDPWTGGGGETGGDYDNFTVDQDGVGRDEIDVSVGPTPYRGQDGATTPSVTIGWSHKTNAKMPYREVRLWCQEEQASTDYSAGAYAYIATLPSGVNTYRYDSQHLEAARRYRFIVQPVTKAGTSSALELCSFATFRPVVATPLLEAPVVTASTQGFKQMYTAKSGNTLRIAAIEGRVGGWLVSTPGFIADPNTDRFISEALLPVPTNAKGDTQAKIYTRSKLTSGRYGKVAITQGSKAFVDVKSSRQLIAENDYTAASDGAVDANLAITSDVLHWKPSSSSLGPIYYTMDELDATSPRRMIPNAIIAGYQVRHETLADLRFTLGSDEGYNWSLEGPMKDDGGNATVIVEWRWTSGASIAAETWRTFEPGEVYARKVQFRLKLERKNAADNVKLTRFTAICNDVPATTMVDGGSF